MDKEFKEGLFKSSAATSLGSGASIIFHFISVMILTRHLSKDDFGIYILILVIVNLFNLLGGFGLELTLVKFIASAKDDKSAYFIPVSYLRALQLLFFGVLFFLFGDLLTPFFDVRINQFILLIPILFFLSSFRDLYYNLLQGLSLFRKYASVQVISAVARVILIVAYLFLNKLTLASLILLEVIVTFLTVVYQFYSIPIKELVSFKFDKQVYKRIISFSLPLYLKNLIVFLSERLNTFVIGAYLNPSSVALFDISGTVPRALKKMTDSFMVVFFPNITRLFSNENKTAALTFMNRSLIFSALVLNVVAALSFIFSEDIIRILFSAQYLEASLAFSLLMFNLYLSVTENILGYSILAAGNPSIPFKANTLSTILGGIASFIFIPWFGFMGAVYAVLLMNIINQTVFQLFLFRINFTPELKKIIQPALLLGLTLAVFYTARLFVDGIFLKVFCLVLFIALLWFYTADFKQMIYTIREFISHFDIKGLVRKKSTSETE